MAKNNSFIIVDEPETYINPSLTNSLWDLLTKLRTDCQFIFITHSVDFVLGRTNAKIAWIKTYSFPDKWEFEILEDDKEIPKALLTEILGSQKSIVFCEGNDKSSLDYHIYKAILEKEFTVIPVQGHRQVVAYCRAVNKLNFNYKAYGIIDGDNYSPEKVKRYQKDNIMVLPFNEIEMFLVNDIILNEAVKNFYPTDFTERIAKFKGELWKRANKEKDRIALDYAKQDVNEQIETQKIEKGDTLIHLKESLHKISEIDVDALYQEKINELEEIIRNNDYDGILRVCNLKKQITKDLAVNNLDKDYEEKIKQQIMVNSKLQEELRVKYFQYLYKEREANSDSSAFER